jgi:hypothetical protein
MLAPLPLVGAFHLKSNAGNESLKLLNPQEIRAMDRRRFVPAPDGLEARNLLASTNLNTLFGLQVTSNLNVPITFQQKSLRIERLPFYLDKIAPHGRFLPKAEIQQIQDSLFNMMDAIHRPPPQALNNYNFQLRKVVARQSLTTDDINRLNFSFGAVLNSAKTPAGSVNGMKSALFKLTSQVDTASVTPATLATNDYTLTLETALAIGRPMPPPQLPRIKRNQGIQAGPEHIKTPLERPTLVGTYHFHTVIQVVTPQGVVVGSENVRKNNNYRVQITTPQSIGVHEFRLRALDDVGHISRLSKPFLIKVVPKRHHHK